MKKLIILATLLLSLIILPSSLLAKTTIKAAHVLASDHPTHIALLRFKDLVSERSKGEIEIQVTNDHKFGGERELAEALQMGHVDLIVICTAPLYDFTTDFLVFDLPYVFPDSKTARAIMDSSIGQERLDNAEAVGLKGLTYYENGLRHISSSDKAIRVPDDLKGLRLRTLESRIHVETFRALGANPIPLSYVDLYQRLKDGSLNGEENPMTVFVTGKLYEVQKYYSLTGHFYMAMPMFISTSVWAKLSPDLQEVLLTAAKESTAYQRELCDGFESASALDELAKKIEVISDIDKAVWIKAVEPVRTKFEAEVGSKTLGELDAALKSVGVSPNK